MIILSVKDRLEFGGIIYETEEYSKNNKCNNSVICYRATDEILIFGTIVEIKDKEKRIVCIRKLEVKAENYNFYTYKLTNENYLVEINNDVKKCVAFSVDTKNYITIIDYYLIVD